jgi:glutathione S-transferase
MASDDNKGDLVLLDFWVSPFGQRCRIALAEKGIPYESRWQRVHTRWVVPTRTRTR